jgi:hypothetical protein
VAEVAGRDAPSIDIDEGERCPRALREIDVEDECPRDGSAMHGARTSTGERWARPRAVRQIQGHDRRTRCHCGSAEDHHPPCARRIAVWFNRRRAASFDHKRLPAHRAEGRQVEHPKVSRRRAAEDHHAHPIRIINRRAGSGLGGCPQQSVHSGGPTRRAPGGRSDTRVTPAETSIRSQSGRRSPCARARSVACPAGSKGPCRAAGVSLSPALAVEGGPLEDPIRTAEDEHAIADRVVDRRMTRAAGGVPVAVTWLR